MLKALGLFCLCCWYYCATAQGPDQMETDRPTETNGSSLVPAGALQFETGILDEKTSGATETILHPDLLLRYGLSKHFELRMEANLSTLKEKESSTGLEPLEAGFKAALWDKKKWWPAASLYFQTGIPVLASGNRKQDHLSPKVRLLFENEITNAFSVQYNMGTEWDGKDGEPEWLYSFAPAVDLGKHWQAFAEVFGFIKKHQAPEHTLDGGLEYFINNGFACDVCSGIGLDKAAPHFFITAGASIRIK